MAIMNSLADYAGSAYQDSSLGYVGRQRVRRVVASAVTHLSVTLI